MDSLPIIQQPGYKISKNELVSPMISLLMARKNEKFKSKFKVVKNGKIVNYISDCNKSSKNNSHVSESQIPKLQEQVGKSSKFISKQKVVTAKRDLDDELSSNSSDFSNSSGEDEKCAANKDELKKNNQMFVSFDYDHRDQKDEKKPEIVPAIPIVVPIKSNDQTQNHKAEMKIVIKNGKYNIIN